MFSSLNLFMHVPILELISFYNLLNYQYCLFCPTCNFLSACLYAKHAFVYICCLNSVYRMKFALLAAVATNLLLCKFDRLWLEGNIVTSIAKYLLISQQIFFNRYCLIHLYMNLHYSKFVAFTAFAFWHWVANVLQMWFFILWYFLTIVLNLLHYSWIQSICLYL